MKNWIMSFQNSAFGMFLQDLGTIFELSREAGRSFLRRRPTMSSIVHEMYHIGVQSFFIVAVAALAVGLVMALQFGYGLQRFGAKLYVPKVVTISIVRELGPIFAALMMAGRVGAGIAAEVGSMKVTQQIDAIRALGTDPYQKLVTPKIIACVLAAPMLTILANMLGIFGGLLISNSALSVSTYDYFFKAFEIINWRDVTGGVFKSVFFGYIIGVVGCTLGLSTSGGTQGVGQATTRSVVTASVYIVMVDFVLTKLLWTLEYMIKSGKLG